MKKLAPWALISYLLSASMAFAASAVTPATPGTITIGRPENVYTDIGLFINSAIRLAFIIALIIVLFMLVWGSVQWIMSGGDKDAVKAARERIIHALVGLAILAISFALATLAGQFIGINLLGQFTIPSPTSPTPSLPTNTP